jgi:hypothetical protein
MISYPDIDAEMMTRVKKVLAGNGSDAEKGEWLIYSILWWRGACAGRAWMANHGAVVKGGLFPGMRWPERLMPGKVLPTLLGTFEKALQPEIAKNDARNYTRVINVGCGVGEYAVGFALRWPEAVIHAHDTDETALGWAREITALNGVEDRVIFGGSLDHASLNALITPRTMIFCDIEGAEEELLNLVRVPNLVHTDIVVEVHEIHRPGLTDRFLPRFTATHDLTLVTKWQSELIDDPYFMALPDIDRVAATCELRNGPTPWAVLRAKNGF